MCLIAFFSCDEKEVEKPTLSVSVMDIVLDKSGVTELDTPAAFDVNSSAGWILASNVTWLTPSVTSGGKGTTRVTVSAEEATTERKGKITVKSDKDKDVYSVIWIIQVTEDLVPPVLMISQTYMTVDFDGKLSDGNPPSFQLSTNKPWEITDLPAWVTASPASGNAGTEITVTLTVEINEQLERNGNFTIEAGLGSERVDIRQLAEIQNLTVTPTFIEVKADGKIADGSEPTVNISTNKNWSITGLPAWITANPASGEAGMNMPVTFTIAKNDLAERTGNFTVNAGYLKQGVSILQLEEEGFESEFPMFVNIGKDAGTSVGQLDVDIIEHAKYWEIITTGGDFPVVPLSLTKSFPPGTTNGVFEYEYQLSEDIPGLWYVPLWDNTASHVFGIGLTATAGVDPDNEAYWTKITLTDMPMWFIIGELWGFNDDLHMCLWFRDDVPRTMLIRNIKITLI